MFSLLSASDSGSGVPENIEQVELVPEDWSDSSCVSCGRQELRRKQIMRWDGMVIMHFNIDGALPVLLIRSLCTSRVQTCDQGVCGSAKM